ncbi:hypothetical protein ROHU_024677 [Labeo rohita]|uniref:Uncharacterized protein n=1 Tax=Labeo rohita TaxID=84645 RepID=A0A498MMR4_LABRO|nr:hypothetical protein ROHU_024677 [Labeo rohita]
MEGVGASLNAKLALVCIYTLMEMYQRQIRLKMAFRSRLNGIDSNLRSRVGCDNIDNVSVRCLIPDFLRCK